MHLNSYRFILNIVLVCIFFTLDVTKADSYVPTGLLTEWRTNPLGVEAYKPGFSWIVNLKGDNQYQSFYQIIVCGELHDVQAGRATIWDSGKIQSNQSTNIIYSGEPLLPGEKYYWSVRNWDKNGQVSDWSGPACFVTGLWDDWKAKWIWVDEQGVNQHVYLRKLIPSDAKPVKHVLAFVSADDYYKLYINGESMGQGPGPSFPHVEYNYNVYDLTPLWHKEGSNCLAAHAYYQGLKNYAWVSGDSLRGFILQLRIIYMDGSTHEVITDSNWKVKLVKVYVGERTLGYSTGYNEDIDAEKIPFGWKYVDYNDADWGNATVRTFNPWKLHAQETDQLVVYPRSPFKIIQKANGHYFFDFGREVVGTLQVDFTGASDSQVEVRLGEEITAPDSVHYKIRANCNYQDFWMLKDGQQELEFYDYRAFRFGELLDSPCILDTSNVHAIVRHYPFRDEASFFTCSSPDLKALWDLAKYSTKMGTQEIYMDCPHREKANYTLDTYLQQSAAAYLAGEYNLARRMIEFSLQSSADGKISCVAPAGRYHSFTEYTMYPILMAWRYYLFTGDKGFLKDNYPALARIENYMRTTFSDDNSDPNPKVVDGLFGNALRFDGKNDFIVIQDSTLSRSHSEMTISAWIKPVSLDHEKNIVIFNRSGDGQSFSLAFKNDGKVLSFGKSGKNNKETNFPVVPDFLLDDKWHHVACNYDGSFANLYLDGKLLGSQLWSGIISSGCDDICIGSNGGNNCFFNGDIDEVALFNRALSLSEIESIYNSSECAYPDKNGLAGYWNLDINPHNIADKNDNEIFNRDILLCGTDRVLQDLVDWPRNRRDGHVMMPINTVVNSVYYRAVKILSEISMVLDKPEETSFYLGRADLVKKCLNQMLWDEHNECYYDGMNARGIVAKHNSLHSSTFPLAMGIVPEQRVYKVIEHMKKRGMNCNMYVALFLFEGLYDNGAGDYAYDILMADGEDTPMNWVRKGATTTWEAWDLEHKWNTSLFHPAGNFVAYIIASRMMGIQPIEPGYKKILIKPNFGKLTSGSIKVPTVKGPVGVRFLREQDNYNIYVNIPDNTTARFEYFLESGTIFVRDNLCSGEHYFTLCD